MLTPEPAAKVAILLVAGVGQRLGAAPGQPKVLLPFAGKTLLERHFAALRAHGIERFALTVGYGEAAIRAEVARLGLEAQVQFVHNPRYREGSLISLWEQRELLCAGAPVLLMDGDVLYDPAMIARLLAAPAENVLLVDRNVEPGDEPMKACFKAGLLVDFRKKPANPYDWYGESVGFFRFSAPGARALAERCDAYVRGGASGTEYEEAIRDLIVATPERFGAVDVSDLPWTEIDFATDVQRAHAYILPRLLADRPAAGPARLIA